VGQEVPRCTGAILGLYWGYTGVGRGGGDGRGWQEQGGLRLPRVAAPEPGKLPEGGEERGGGGYACVCFPGDEVALSGN